MCPDSVNSPRCGEKAYAYKSVAGKMVENLNVAMLASMSPWHRGLIAETASFFLRGLPSADPSAILA